MSSTTQQIWACEETAVVDYLSRRETFDASSIDGENKAFLSDLFSREKTSILSVSEGVATIAISGVLSKEGPDLIDKLLGLGGTSYAEIEKVLETAAADPEVRQIRLAIDSPGGAVVGVDEARGAIARAANKKELVAVNTGMTASAAYWLASAAQKVVSTSPTNVTGSIGVVAVAIDRTERDRRFGVVTVVSRNAPDKRPNLQTDAGRAVIQDQVDALERVFLERIAEGRGISVETIKRDFGRGRVMVAIDPDSTKPSALSVGMIDGVIDGFASAGLKPRGGGEAAVLEEVAQATITVEPPCAAGDEKMTEELNTRIAELEKQLGTTKAAQGDLESRMAAVAPILASDVYPAVIKEIAGRVLSGQEHPKALEGAVAVFDAKQAEEQIEIAKQASDEAPVANPKAVGSNVPADGSIVSAESLEAQVKAMRQMLGKE